MTHDETITTMAVLAAGALAGGVATSPEEAAKFAAECFEKLHDADYERRGASKTAMIS